MPGIVLEVVTGLVLFNHLHHNLGRYLSTFIKQKTNRVSKRLTA